MTDPIPPKLEDLEINDNGFDVDKALNTKGFPEFLAAHPDSETFDMQDISEVRKRYETFEAEAFVIKELKDLYSGHIEKEMGIKLDSTDLASIEEHIESQSLQNPEEIIKMKERIDAFKSFPIQIADLEKQLAKLGNADDLAAKLEALKTDKSDLETGKKYLGLGGKTKLAYHIGKIVLKTLPMTVEILSNTDFLSEEYSEGVRKEAGEMSQSAQASLNIGKKFGKISKEEAESLEGGIQSQIMDVENTLVNIQQLGELKSLSQELFGKIRKDLLGGVSDIAELTVAIQAKVSAQFQQMTKDGSIKALDQAQKRFESLKSVSGSTETGVNPLGGIDEEVFQEQVDASLEKKASEEIMEKVLQVSMGTNAFTRLEKALEPFLKREKIGSKEGDEARDFIARTLKEAADNLSDANEDRAKKLMISRLLIKMKS